MNNKDLAKSLIDKIPEERLHYVMPYLEGASIPNYNKEMYNTVNSKDILELTDEDSQTLAYLCGVASSYWCCVSAPPHCGRHNNDLLFGIKMLNGSRLYQLTMCGLLKGVALYLNSNDCVIEVSKKDGKVYLDLDSIDSDAANSILQYSLFGKIIY